MIENGEIGELHDIDIKMTVYTPWHLWDFLYDLPRVEILYHSVHYIDLVRLFFGNPVKVFARTIKHPKMQYLSSTKSNIYMDYGEYKRQRSTPIMGTNSALSTRNHISNLKGPKEL